MSNKKIITGFDFHTTDLNLLNRYIKDLKRLKKIEKKGKLEIVTYRGDSFYEKKVSK